MQHQSLDNGHKGGAVEESKNRAWRLAEALQPWRQALVRADAVLHWERPAALGCLLACLTLAFALLAFCRPPPLSALALACLLVALADLAVPRLTPLLLGNAWSDADQACYSAVCQRLLGRWDAAVAAVRHAARTRRDRPQAFAATAGAGLLAAALVGSCVSGLFLAYVAAVAAVLWPGLTRHGVLQWAAADLKACLQAKLFGKGD